MASFLQMDIKDLFSKKKDSNKKVSNSNIQKILFKRLFVILLILILIFISYWFILKPRSEKQAIKLNELEQWKEQLISCDQENKILNNALVGKSFYFVHKILIIQDMKKAIEYQKVHL